MKIMEIYAYSGDKFILKRINMIKNSPNGEIFKNHAIGR